LVIGIKESALFNATIVVIKVSVVLFVIGLGIAYVNRGNGERLVFLSPYGLSGSVPGPHTSSSPTLASTRFPPPHRRRKSAAGTADRNHCFL